VVTAAPTRVPVPAPTRAPGGETTAHVVGDLLVDPADRTDDLDRAVADAGVEHVLVTHAHPDHVGGVAAYADGRTVWAHADHRDRFRDAAGLAPDRTFRPGDRVAGHEVLATPGHAPDHVALAGGEWAIVGDLAVATGSVVVGAPEGDLRAYLDSLERVRDRGFDRLYPAHGPVIDDPAAVLSRLYDHRVERERRVHEAVTGGARTVEAVLAAAYDKDLTGVEDLARATVRAHLEKLADDGHLDFDGERARPREE
jgi:glyoxylase-like metal-dependent hydrolase (beta-lactamase superfamily II)